MRPERLGRDEVGERELFVLAVPRLDDVPSDLQPDSRYFASLLALDARGIPDDQILNMARGLLTQGAVYVCTWGPECERVHDLFDQADIERDPNFTDDSVVLTTSHSSEPLSEALWFLLNMTQPAADYVDACRAGLVITVRSSEWSSEARSALSAPREFSARVLESESHD